MEHFTGVFNEVHTAPAPVPIIDVPTPPHLQHLDGAVSELEFNNAIRDTNLSSAPGPDGLPPRLLVSALSTPEFYVFMFHFMQMCFLLSYVPSQWREAYVFVLYKGRGNPLDPNSYRGISLTPILAKMYERILLSRLQSWVSTTPISHLPQFGFRPRCSTVQAVFLLQSVVHEVVTIARKTLFAVFIDLTKAFPSINRDAMFKFLANRGVPSPLLKAIRSFYIGNKARLRVDNLLTVAINVTLGVLEGSCLSPFLFSTVFSVVWDFVNCADFPSSQPRVLNLGEIWLIAFADDIVILSVSHARLQAVLTKLFTELKNFNLSINLIKTETLTFQPPRIRTQGQAAAFSLDNKQLVQVELFKYLGIFVSSNWGFSCHITRMQGRAEAAAVELIRLATRLDIRSPGRVSVFYRSLVESQWHGLEIMPQAMANEMELTRAHFIKKFFDLPSPTANLLTLLAQRRTC